MRIILIRPPLKNLIKTEVPECIGEEVGVLPPLGLMYLQSYLSKNSEHETVIIDGELDDVSHEELAKLALSHDPDLIGVTSHTHNLLDAVLVINALKELASELPVCLGGSHSTAFPAESAILKGVDFSIAGEGEEAFLSLLDALEEGSQPRGIPGVAYRTDDGVFSQPPAHIRNIDSLPFPDRRLVQYERYRYILHRESAVGTVVTSRGCPYRCTFCSTPRGGYRTRSPASVLEELEHCRSLGLREIYFVDDTFNVYPERVEEICQGIIDRGIDIRWSFRARIDRVTARMLELAKRSGCIRIQYGVETATDDGLQLLGKNITIEQVREVFRLTRDAGIETVAYFMIGCPHERTREDVLKTVDFAIELAPDYAMFGILTPYPNTKLYEEALERGLFQQDYWRNYALEPYADFVPKFWEEHLSSEELLELLRTAYHRFYLRPRYILRRLRSLSSLRDFIHKARAGLRILRL